MLRRCKQRMTQITMTALTVVELDRLAQVDVTISIARKFGGAVRWVTNYSTQTLTM